MPDIVPHPALDLIENFPAFDKAGAYLKRLILEHGYRDVADIGGGANPLLDDDFIRKNGIRYFLIDKSGDELAKTDILGTKLHADAAGADDAFQVQTGRRSFDLIFSHMFLEHVDKPLQVHRNFFRALNPGGRCVHFYPSPNNLPLALNRLLPEVVSSALLKLAQPRRDLEGRQKKFKAYYRMCGAPNSTLTAWFGTIGYAVERHTGYIGHTYYNRFRALAAAERSLRQVVYRLKLPLTSGCLLVLLKPVPHPADAMPV